MRSILVLAALLMTMSPTHAASDWSSTIQKVERSVVYIQSGIGEDAGGCTGFVINAAHNLVLTAAHCYNEKMFVDLSPALVAALDTHEDLMVVAVPLLDDRPALPLAAKNPKRGHEVLSIGHGYALEVTQSRVAHIAAQDVHTDEAPSMAFFSLDAPFIPGQSGGPVVNEAGEVVMIVQRSNGLDGIGIPAETIRARVGRFFETK